MASRARRAPDDGYEGAPDDDGVEEDGVEDALDDATDEGPSPTRTPSFGRGLLARARATVAAPEIDPGKSDFSTKWAIDRLDPREKQFTLAASGGALLFGVGVYFIETTNASFRLTKGQLTPQTTLVLGLVSGALLFGSALLGRRAPTGFVAVLTGLFFSNAIFFLSFPFLALGIWILIRSFKIQRETTAKLKEARAEAAAKPGRTRSASPASSTSRGSRAAPASRRSTSPGNAPWESSKRYTPKRPPLPVPKPSRRERKAARAAE